MEPEVTKSELPKPSRELGGKGCYSWPPCGPCSQEFRRQPHPFLFSIVREEGLRIRGRNEGRLGQKGFCGRSHRVQCWTGGSGIFRGGWAGMCPHLPVPQWKRGSAVEVPFSVVRCCSMQFIHMATKALSQCLSSCIVCSGGKTCSQGFVSLVPLPCAYLEPETSTYENHGGLAFTALPFTFLG